MLSICYTNKHTPTLYPNSSILKHLSKRSENVCPKKIERLAEEDIQILNHSQNQTHFNCTENIQLDDHIKQWQMSVIERMKWQADIYSYNGTLQRGEELISTNTCKNINDS